MEEVIKNICREYKCSKRSVRKYRDQISLEIKEAIDTLAEKESFLKFHEREKRREIAKYAQDLRVTEDIDEGEEEECICPCSKEALEVLPEETWHGYFKGYTIMCKAEDYQFNESKKCVEISQGVCSDTLISYLRVGVRCFAIDLFSGTVDENRTLIAGLRQAENTVTEEYGFPVMTTLLGKLSPRMQYTGIMNPPDSYADLVPGDELTLTSDRYWSSRGSSRRIYVNARALIAYVQECNFILIGQDLQVHVKELSDNSVHCIVSKGGRLKAHLPVLFPKHCSRFMVSIEELEDIMLAKEMGVNVLVSFIAGTRPYFENLRDVIRHFEGERVHICARVVLNRILGDAKDTELDWVINDYDCFLLEVERLQEAEPDEVLRLCPAAVRFIKRIYASKKPIIFDPTPIIDMRIIVDSDFYTHIFYLPDKYLIKCYKTHSSVYFNLLQCAAFEAIPSQELSKQPFCDRSNIGSDSLARACISASFEMHATAIFVCSETGRMAIKLSHFRPKIPIFLLTTRRSVSEYIHMYHNVVMFVYRGEPESQCRSVYKQLLFGLMFASSRKLIRHEDNVILVYSQEPRTKFSDKFISYKFDERFFSNHLCKLLFKHN